MTYYRISAARAGLVIAVALAAAAAPLSPMPLATVYAARQLVADSVGAAADKGRILGSEKASVWMIIVSDFQCPFCKQWHTDSWETLKKEYVNTGKIRVAYVNFPLGIHPNARPAAISAMCASAQGKFWPMADLLFKNQDKWKGLKDARPYFDSLAKAAGADAGRLKSCITSPGVAAMVDADRTRMMQAKAESTPTFYIGGARVEGAQPIAVFRRAIDAELAAAKR